MRSGCTSASVFFFFFYGLKGFRALWTPSGGLPLLPTRLERVFFPRDGSFGDAEGEDGRAAARLIEVRLSPACETKEDGFRSASPEVEGGWRAHLERGVCGGGEGLKRRGAKSYNRNQIRLKSQFDFSAFHPTHLTGSGRSSFTSSYLPSATLLTHGTHVTLLMEIK